MKYEPHPYAELFPALTGETLSKLADDIAANGLREQIVRYSGKILDGRNRLAACELRGITPQFIEYTGDDPLGFVISKNLHRRHLDESQRAAVAAKLSNVRREDTLRQGDGPRSANLRNGEAPVSQAKAAGLLNVSERLVTDAKKVQTAGVPELGAMVDAGEVPVSAAAEVAKLPKAEQKKAVAGGAAKVKETAKTKRESRKKPAPEPVKQETPAAAESEQADTPEPATTPDPDETPEQKREREAVDHVAEVEAICYDLDQLAKRVEALKASPYAYTLHTDSAAASLKAVRKQLWVGRADHLCPYCKGEGCKPDRQGRSVCNETGRVKRSTYDAGVEAVGGAA